MKQPQIWHHGLVARNWGEFETEGGKEALYFRSIIERSGQPVLDLGCGSGRLLLSYLQAGLHVDGCDYSADMIEQCRKRADTEGFAPQLYTQATHELDLPHRYKTIFACGVVGLGGERQLTQAAMHRCHEHLRPGGSFAFDYQVRWNDPPAWMSRLPEHRNWPLPDWPESGERKRLSDGTELELVTRTISMDPLEEVATRQIRARLWQDDEMIKEEIHTQKLDDYSKNELVLMLKVAGFQNIQLYGDYTDEPATMDHQTLIFVAEK
ncbi:class I SAM-dependent methyltransferase [Chloroflexi bacterium TSY]|nr:class I SAM-dependent methyltransferase [Chloroflexi bacterium TSY]